MFYLHQFLMKICKAEKILMKNGITDINKEFLIAISLPFLTKFLQKSDRPLSFRNAQFILHLIPLTGEYFS